MAGMTAYYEQKRREEQEAKRAALQAQASAANAAWQARQEQEREQAKVQNYLEGKALLEAALKNSNLSDGEKSALKEYAKTNGMEAGLGLTAAVVDAINAPAPGKGKGLASVVPPSQSRLVVFDTEGTAIWSNEERAIVISKVEDVAAAYARTIDEENLMLWRMGDIPNYQPISPTRAFLSVHGGPIKFTRSSSTPGNAGITLSKNHIILYDIKDKNGDVVYGYLARHPLVVVHEIGHAFNNATNKNAQSNVPSELYRPKTESGVDTVHSVYDQEEKRTNYFGFAGGWDEWQFGNSPNSENSEVFCDMFIGWVYGQWEVNPEDSTKLTDLGQRRESFMNASMSHLIADARERVAAQQAQVE
jgi:hypothetical protein